MRKKRVFSFRHQAMATFFEVMVAGEDEDYSRSAARAFFREIDRLEGFLSRFDPGSEISRINRLKPGEILPIGLETFEFLKLSFQLMVETGGAFNINFRALKDAEVESRRQGEKARVIEGKSKLFEGESSAEKTIKPKKGGASRKSSEEARAEGHRHGEEAAAYEKDSGPRGYPVLSDEKNRENFLSVFPLELVEENRGYAAVRLEVPGASLDLDPGAIGKGYALEKACGIFSDWEIEDFLVSAGGSTVFARGPQPWPVAVGGGFDFFRPGKISLKGSALSGSGHEVKGEHIFDPWRRIECSRHLAVWVLHPSPAVADGLSTAFMVMSLDEIRHFAQRHPEVSALILSRRKKSYFFNEMNIYEPGSERRKKKR
ncbi:MAG: FAD:protein FMN transferase [Candidatus Saccharicenans sp.]|nr:FAD:protein FMN transferase [Candidatus Saccharicenans sp.]